VFVLATIVTIGLWVRLIRILLSEECDLFRVVGADWPGDFVQAAGVSDGDSNSIYDLGDRARSAACRTGQDTPEGARIASYGTAVGVYIV
jgi:hypothetical protein